MYNVELYSRQYNQCPELGLQGSTISFTVSYSQNPLFGDNTTTTTILMTTTLMLHWI